MAEHLSLIKLAQLALKRKRSKKDYFNFQAYQAELITAELKARGVIPINMKMLELGCGIGGYSPTFKREFRDLVTADMRKPWLLLRSYPQIKFLKFDVCKSFPIKDKEFDIVFCSGTIEHVYNPNGMLKEIYRVLKEEGILILTFPPFFSPVGGHHFKPFHYLGEKLAIKLTNLFKNTRIRSYKSACGKWGLYPLKIADVERLLIHAGFKINDKWVRFLPWNIAKIPIVNEILTWHINFLCTKANTKSKGHNSKMIE